MLIGDFSLCTASLGVRSEVVAVCSIRGCGRTDSLRVIPSSGNLPESSSERTVEV